MLNIKKHTGLGMQLRGKMGLPHHIYALVLWPVSEIDTRTFLAQTVLGPADKAPAVLTEIQETCVYCSLK